MIKLKRPKKFFLITCTVCVSALCCRNILNAGEKVHNKCNNLLSNANAGASLLDFSKKNDSKLIPIMDLDDSDTNALLQIAAAEAGTEDSTGKALVMCVVLNRVESEKFPNTVREVLFQQIGGRFQFCPVRNGSYYTAALTEDCYEALDLVLYGWDESQGATYFCTPEAANKWHEDNLEFLFQHGNHRFYIEKRESNGK